MSMTRRIALSLGMVCGLTAGVFPTPAAAKLIVVTTLGDTADPPFNADGLWETGTIDNLPGADGLVSLREALIAANNTPGADTISFAANLSGGTIVVSFDDLDGDPFPDPLPALCGGQTTITGDINSDEAPDITLEGAAFSAAARIAGVAVFSSHNTIEGLRVQHFPNGIVIGAGLTGTATIKHTTVTNNIVKESPAGIVVLTGDALGSILADTVIIQNLVQHTFFGIVVQANFTAAGADTYITHTTITDNEVRENRVGILLVPVGARNRITDLTIARNIASANAGQGIQVYGGNR